MGKANMSLLKTRASLLLALALCVGLAWVPTPPRTQRGLLDPFASFAATIQWARADAAFDEGQIDLGLTRAESALELNPSATAGWSWLASVLVHRFGSPEFETVAATRRAWVETGLNLLARGEELAREPAELAFHAGLVMAYVASIPDEILEWPGGTAAAWRASAEHFERAKELGHPRAEESAQAAWLEVYSPHKPHELEAEPAADPALESEGAQNGN